MSGKTTLTSREIQTAVRLVIPGELVKVHLVLRAASCMRGGAGVRVRLFLA
jgi:hypothetical protein